MLSKPKCLHVPTLHEGEPANLSWAVVEGAAGYILERQFNETFEDASKGRTWSQLESAGKTWDQIEAKGLTWAQFEDLPSVPGYVVYDGVGNIVPGPEQGRSWSQLEGEELSWDGIESKNLTWEEIECLPAIGKHWGELDRKGFTWDDFEAKGLTWREFELLIPSGMSWETLDAHWLSWDEFEANNLSWEKFEQLVDRKDHLGATDHIEIGAKSAMYRIKAYDVAGRETGYLTSNLRPIIPIFYREALFRWQARAGVRYRVLIEGENLRDVERVPLTFRYGAEVLTLEDFIVQIPGKQIRPGIYPSAYLQIDANFLGEVRFRSTRPVGSRESWSGCVTYIEFIARRSGMAEVSLQ